MPIAPGELVDTTFLTPERAEVHYVLPLAEIVFDFFDHLKSNTRGYASLDYEPWGYQESDVVRVDVLLHGEPVDAFSTIVHRSKAYAYGKQMTERLRELIPRQLFDVAIQAAIGSKIIARETVKAKRKDVLAKVLRSATSRASASCSRHRRGKARLRKVGRVDVPQEAFIEAFAGRGGEEEVARTSRRPGSTSRAVLPDAMRATRFHAYAGLDNLSSRYVAALLSEAELAAPAWETWRSSACSSVEAADDARGGRPANAPRPGRSVSQDARRGGHDEANPDTVGRAEARGSPGGRLRTAVDGRAVVRPFGTAALERVHRPRRGRGFRAARVVGTTT